MSECLANSTVPWVLTNDLCRCCHAEGNFKSIGYPFCDAEETSEIMNMLEFIGIKIEPKQGDFGMATFKICNDCFTQLRYATIFKEQVISCENSFQMLCEKNLIKDENEVKEVKLVSDDEYDYLITDSPEPGDDEMNLEQFTYEDAKIDKNEFENLAKEIDEIIIEQVDIEDTITTDIIESSPVEADTRDETENSAKEMDEIIIEQVDTEDATNTESIESPQVDADTQTETENSAKEMEQAHTEDQTTTESKGSSPVEAVTQAETENSAKEMDVQNNKEEKNTLKYLRDLKERLKKAKVKSGNQPVVEQKISHTKRSRCCYKKNHINGDMFHCARCDFTHEKRNIVRFHYNTNHCNGNCGICSRKFPDAVTLRAHQLDAHKMSIGDEQTPLFGAWTNAVVEENGLFKCAANANAVGKRATKCDKVVHQNKEVILHHLAITHFKFRCNECPERYRTITGINRHLLTKHNINKIINCGSCDKEFYDNAKYNNHLKSYHKLGELIKCDKCDFESYCQSTFRKHRLKHTDDKPFACRFCEKKFKRRASKSLHEKIHTREGLKQCPYCEQSFVQRTSVKYHVLKHHPGERI